MDQNGEEMADLDEDDEEDSDEKDEKDQKDENDEKDEKDEEIKSNKDEEEKQSGSDDEESDEDIIVNENKKVRFAETFEQREDVIREEEAKKAEDAGDAVEPKKEKPKKLKVNQEYVKDIVRKQLKTKLHNQ